MRLILRMLARDWRAGELTVLALALLLAVASLSSVAFLGDRIGQALVLEAHQLLGGDLLLSADHPWDDALRQRAQGAGLDQVDSVSFPSMVASGQGSQLSEVKAVGQGYPLRGRLRVAPALNVADAETGAVPAPGSVWLDERLTTALSVREGEQLALGRSRVAVAAVLTLEPDRGVNLFAIAPRLMMNLADLPATGLIQAGSRVTYRLHLAGDAASIAAFKEWLTPRLKRGERVEDLGNARQDIRNMMDRAQRFLSLAALLAVVLAAVAVGFAADRYTRRHLDGCAVMRCLGASQNQVLAVHGGEFLVFGMTATLAGLFLGYLAQWGLQEMLAGVMTVALPAPSLRPWLLGLLVGATLVSGFILPPLLRLRQVSTLRVLRREWAADSSSILGYAFGGLVLALLMLWVAGDLRLGAIVLGGFVAAALLYAGLARAALLALGGVRAAAGAGWRIGLANLRRHGKASVLMATALGLGFTALLLLTVARQDLLDSWRQRLPPDAPNRFIINIQPEQRQPIGEYFAVHGLDQPELEPMVRGRLATINERPVQADSYEDERAQRLVEREFNLSWSAVLPEGNSLVAGRWHGQGQVQGGQGEFSVEQGLAETLHLALGDSLSFEIAGVRLSGKISSLRRLDWDSMRVNFFVLTPPGLLESYPASYITSFHLAPEQGSFVDGLVHTFPNLTVIDVASLLRQMQAMVNKLGAAVQAVFGFALAAGFVVLYAAMQASNDERRYELAVLRALGASAAQLRGALLAEFAALGAIAGLLAGIGASGISWALAHLVFHLDYTPAGQLLPLGMLFGALGVALAGWLGSLAILRQPPLQSLRGDA